MIDPRAIIDPSARVAADVTIAPFAVIGPNVEIGAGSRIGAHTIIHRNTKLGRDNRIDAFVSLGGDPQHTHYNEEDTYLEMGDGNVVREFCTINRGTQQGGGVTRLGNRNYLMAYSHVAHDCVLGNEVVLANGTNLAGHVEVGDYVFFSAFSAAHQFVRIGAYSFLGRATKIGQDIPPYMLVTGTPGAPRGINLVGLKRRGFTEQTLRQLRRAYSLVYRKDLRLQDAIEQLLPVIQECPELQSFVDMLQSSKRGIAR